MRGLRVVAAVMMAAALLLAVGMVPHPTLADEVAINGNCDYAELSTKISSATSGDTITFDCADNVIDFHTGETIIIDKVISIDGSNDGGASMVLDGNDETNFFLVTSSGNLSVEQMTLQHGWDDLEGGAIDVGGTGALTVANVTFIANDSATYGGAINVDDGIATINQSTFTNNESGGGTGNSYGGAIYTQGTMTISQSTFTGNETGGGNGQGHGGAIANYGTLTLSQSTFTGNEAGGGNGASYGGAIHSYGTLTANRNSFIDNTAGGGAGDGYGGAISFVTGFAKSIVASTFSGNMANTGSTIWVGDDVPSAQIAWSTIAQPPTAGSAALNIDGLLELEGVLLAGDGSHCEFGGTGSLTDSYTLANDTSCGLNGTGSKQNLDTLGIGSLTTSTINGIEQSYHPLLEDSIAIDLGPTSCDTDIIDGIDPDQLGNPRPNHQYCDIGAIESPFAAPALCANQWNGAIHLSDDCSRSETQIKLPQDAPITLCVNNWNGSARLSHRCSRSEHEIAVTGDNTIPSCINNWNGTLRISDRCTRSETQHWL